MLEEPEFFCDVCGSAKGVFYDEDKLLWLCSDPKCPETQTEKKIAKEEYQRMQDEYGYELYP